MFKGIRLLKLNREKMASVLIYLAGDGVCMGHLDCPPARLIELLNSRNIFRPPDDEDEELAVMKARVYTSNKREAGETIFIKKKEILFIKLMGHWQLPSLPVKSSRVKLDLPTYTLIGRIHYPSCGNWRGILDSISRFIMITDVEIILRALGISHRVAFAIVNKDNIFCTSEV